MFFLLLDKKLKSNCDLLQLLCFFIFSQELWVYPFWQGLYNNWLCMPKRFAILLYLMPSHVWGSFSIVPCTLELCELLHLLQHERRCLRCMSEIDSAVLFTPFFQLYVISIFGKTRNPCTPHFYLFVHFLRKGMSCCLRTRMFVVYLGFSCYPCTQMGFLPRFLPQSKKHAC